KLKGYRMPDYYDPRGGFSRAVSVRQGTPGWDPFQTERDRQVAEQDEAERRRYLTNESRRELEKFAIRRPPAPEPFTPKAPTGEIDPVDEIVDAISNQRLFVDREKLVAAGKERFEKLLELGREIRRFGIGLQIELSDFRQLNSWISNL